MGNRERRLLMRQVSSYSKSLKDLQGDLDAILNHLENAGRRRESGERRHHDQPRMIERRGGEDRRVQGTPQP
jgi:hypothetical protein